TEVDRGLAEVQRLHLRVNVGDVQQRHVAEVLGRQQRLLAQRLLRGKATPAAAGPDDRRKGDGSREEGAPGEPKYPLFLSAPPRRQDLRTFRRESRVRRRLSATGPGTVSA